MRKILLNLPLVIIAFIFSSCDKAGVSAAKPISADNFMACTKAISAYEKQTEFCRFYQKRALAGDRDSAGMLYNYTFIEPRKSSYKDSIGAKMTMQEVAAVLRPPSAGDSAEYRSLYERYQNCILQMQQVGFGSGLPLIEAARMGAPVAQYHLYELLSNVLQRDVVTKAGFMVTDNIPTGAYCFISYADYSPKVVFDDVNDREYPADVLRHADDKLPRIEMIEPAMASPSNAYMLDADWRAPSGPWDPFYKDGKYAYNGIMFSPRELLTKAAAERENYRARLAAVEFISTNSAQGREVAAKSLLGLAGRLDWPHGDVLVSTCLAAIHLRGIGTPVDLPKAVEVMISSDSGSLVARGVFLACRRGVLLNSDSSDDLFRIQLDDSGRELAKAVCHQFGYGAYARDLERAYFHYYRFLVEHELGHDADAQFARERMNEIENYLKPDSVVRLQRDCNLWHSRWNSSQPSYSEWRERYSADQQQPR